MKLFNKKSRKDAVFAPGKEHKPILHKNLDFTASEQYKLLRTNLDFVLSEDENTPIIGITSSVRGEGKSTTAINLAYVIAEKGKRVALIDCDLRLPSVARRLEIENKNGLTDILLKKEFKLMDYKSEISENLFVIPSGEIPPNPSELLGSKRMMALLNSLKSKFDCIIIDLPPVNIVSDSLSVSPFITGLIVVVRERYTEKKSLNYCIRQLKLSNVNVLGIVMNDAYSGGKSYGKYKKYKYYKRSTQESKND